MVPPALAAAHGTPTQSVTCFGLLPCCHLRCSEMLSCAALLYPASSYSPLTCSFFVVQNLALTRTFEGGPLMHFCFITCPFQFASGQLRCVRPNSPAPLANNTVLLQTIRQRSHSKDSPGKVTSQNPSVKQETRASQGYCIRHQQVEVCDCRAHGFEKVLVLQHPKGLPAGLGALLCSRII